MSNVRQFNCRECQVFNRVHTTNCTSYWSTSYIVLELLEHVIHYCTVIRNIGIGEYSTNIYYSSIQKCDANGINPS